MKLTSTLVWISKSLQMMKILVIISVIMKASPIIPHNPYPTKSHDTIVNKLILANSPPFTWFKHIFICKKKIIHLNNIKIAINVYSFS